MNFVSMQIVMVSLTFGIRGVQGVERMTNGAKTVQVPDNV